MNDIDKVILKIQDLMRLSASAGENEAKAATFAAEKLIAKYRITEQMLNGNRNSDHPVSDDTPVYVSKRITMWKVTLINFLANHYGCVSIRYLSYENKRQVSSYRLFGRKEDMRIVRNMFNSLESIVSNLTRLNAYGKGHVYAHSYSHGVTDGILLQLKESMKQIADEFTNQAGGALAVVNLNNRAEQNMKRLQAMDKKIVKAEYNPQGLLDPNAYAKGVVTGKALDLP